MKVVEQYKTPEARARKRAYDRKRQAEGYIAYKERRAEYEHQRGDKCESCSRKRDGSKGTELHLHHIYYHPIESDYPRKGHGHSRVKRLEEAIAHPERFVLLCMCCHGTVHKLQFLIARGISIEKLISYIPADGVSEASGKNPTTPTS